MQFNINGKSNDIYIVYISIDINFTNISIDSILHIRRNYSKSNVLSMRLLARVVVSAI